MRQAYGHAFVTYQAELTPGERRDLPAAAVRVAAVSFAPPRFCFANFVL